ncbi:acyltransferase [Enterobacter ludwigii]|uniref:acyltransferase family protein n=1 Tax=Enterobacter ludwigii TaxID=299767 RepID=UPI001C8B361B|nr:acyltransferase [Enterobacter ludwigii]MBX8878324.1 acyltransferase [Enterobacter ludwigii]
MGKIYSIQYLRGIAAILVVFLHIRTLLPDFLKSYVLNGGIGVDIFFIISGFIIYYATQNINEASPKIYLTKRVFRIWPLFIVVWFITSIIAFQEQPFYKVIQAVFFVHNDYSQGAPGFGFNMIGPAWTLTFEMVFYAIFMIACMISHKYRGVICAFLLVVIPSSLQLYFNGNVSFSSYTTANLDSSHFAYGLIRVLGCNIYLEFGIGILISMFVSRYRKTESSLLATIVSIPIFLLCLYVIFNIKVTELERMVLALTTFLSALIFGYGCVKEIRTLSFFGDISYSIYLCHWMVIRLFMEFFPGQWTMEEWGVKVPAILLTTIIISWLMNRFIEKPSIKMARRLLSNSYKFSPA